MTGTEHVAGLRTASLRRRVLLTAAAVLAIVLVGVVLVVNGVFAATVAHGQKAVLGDHAQLARQLARQGATPQALIRRVDARGVRARLVLTDGTGYGSLDRRHAHPDALRRQLVLAGPGRLSGARLTLVAGTGLLRRAQPTLLWVLVLTGAAALVVMLAALLVGVRFALAPLDAMTSLARTIARGGRGRRLWPTRTDTELGRTAAAFDEMLDALEGAEAQARASEAQTRRFVADAAHELRTPIAGVVAAAEAALQRPRNGAADAEEQERLQLLLVRESRRAARLVEDLLDLAQIDAGLSLRREPVGLRALAGEQVQRARMLYPGRGVELRGPEVVVDADPARVGQVIASLVDNACQATSENGSVTVTITGGRTSAEVLVTDDGPGVPAADRERIFDRLTRLDEARDRRRGGSGLGLAIARGIARAHGGDLRCEAPAPGTPGAVFRLVLPSVAGTAPVQPPAGG